MTFSNEFVIGIHAKFLGITENNMLQFKYDARMTMYLLMGAFKLGVMLFFSSRGWCCGLGAPQRW
jgi:hypothetical protein